MTPAARCGRLPAHGELSNGKKLVLIGDMGGFVHAIDAKTSELQWTADIKFFKNQMVTSTPVLYKDRVYAPISQYELASAAADLYVCCKGARRHHGAGRQDRQEDLGSGHHAGGQAC